MTPVGIKLPGALYHICRSRASLLARLRPVQVRCRSESRIRATPLSGLGLLTYLYHLLHSSHVPGVEPDLDAVRVVGGFGEDVFHDAASEPPAPLIWLLRDVDPQPWPNVFAVLPVPSHLVAPALASATGAALPANAGITSSVNRRSEGRACA